MNNHTAEAKDKMINETRRFCKGLKYGTIIAVMLWTMIFMSINAFALIDTAYVSPTLANNSITNNRWAEINTSINASGSLSEITYDWNNINYSFFDQDLVLYYTFENASSLGESNTVVESIYGPTRTGTVTGSPVLSNCIHNKCWTFGADSRDKIDISNEVATKLNDTATVSAWIRPINCTAQQSALGKYYGWFGFTVLANDIRFGWEIDGIRTITATNGCSLTQWNHLVGVINSTGTTTTMTFYINGVYQGNLTAENNATRIGNAWDISSNGNNDKYFNGSIDDIAMWNKSMTPEEVTQLYFMSYSKYNNDSYSVYVNQSLNSTTGLFDGPYQYNVFSNVSTQSGNSIITIDRHKVFYINTATGDDTNDGTSQLTAWKTITKLNSYALMPGDFVLFARGEKWRSPEDSYISIDSGNTTDRITYGSYGNKNLPLPVITGSVNLNDPNNWTLIGTDLWASKPTSIVDDVGNIRYDDSDDVGAKYWNFTNLSTYTRQGSFWHNNTDNSIVVYSVGNPGTVYTEVEAAMKGVLIPTSSIHDVNFWNITLTSGGSHGLGITSSFRVNITNCNFTFIGGSKQTGEIRYGNCMELWNGANNMFIYNNTFYQCFDEAFTAQGQGNVFNIFIRYNFFSKTHLGIKIWDKESTPGSFYMRHVYIEHNTGLFSGYEWSSYDRQDFRPETWGLGDSNITQTINNISIKDNIAYMSKLDHLFIWNNDSYADKNDNVIDYNLYYSENVSSWLSNVYFRRANSLNFSNYVLLFQHDENSIIADPLFSPTFYPYSDSPVCGAASDGSDLGAYSCLSYPAPTPAANGTDLVKQYAGEAAIAFTAWLPLIALIIMAVGVVLGTLMMITGRGEFNMADVMIFIVAAIGVVIVMIVLARFAT